MRDSAAGTLPGGLPVFVVPGRELTRLEALVRRCQGSPHGILAVDRRAVAGGALVAAGPTWRLLDELIDGGYTRGQIARWLGATRPALQIRHDRVTAKTAAKVEKLYRLLRQGKLARPATLEACASGEKGSA